MKPLIFFALSFFVPMTLLHQLNAGGERQDQPVIMVEEGREKKSNASGGWRDLFKKWRRSKQHAAATYELLMDEQLSEARDFESDLHASKSADNTAGTDLLSAEKP